MKMFFHQRFCAALMCLMAAFAPLPALAQANVVNSWTSCDGYGKATKAGDGMTEYATVLLIFSPPGYGNTGKGDQRIGWGAVLSCDDALGALSNGHWRRKVSLLRARALHRLEASQSEGVLADLDLAVEASGLGRDDPLFQRSQGLGLDVVRTFALRRLGRPDEARATGARLVDARPYSREVMSSVALALGDVASDTDSEKLAWAMGRLVPQARTWAMQTAFDEGRFDEVLSLYAYSPSSFDRSPMSPVMLEVIGMRAYALAATGKAAEARSVLNPGKFAVAPKQTNGKGAETASALDAATGPVLARQDREALARWSQAVERRIMVSEGRSAQVIATLEAEPLVGDGSGVDTLLALAATLPDQDATLARTSALTLRAKLRSQRRSATESKTDIADLFRMLPEAETTARLPPWREAKRPLLAMKGSMADTTALGYRETVGAGGLVTVRFRGGNSPSGVVEEMALLRAAQLAREAGKKGFVIIDRRDTAWKVNTTYYGSTLRSDPGGFECEIDVRFVDPPTTGAAHWIGLETEAVYATLAPIYIPDASAAQTASR